MDQQPSRNELRLQRFLWAGLFLTIGWGWASAGLAQEGSVRREKNEAGEWTITTPHYSAVVAPDGCLTEVRTAEGNWLAPGVGISRGTYFFRQNPLALSPAVENQPRSLVAENSEARVAYSFEENRITCRLENLSPEGMVFFAVLAADCRVSQTSAGALQTEPWNGETRESIWLRGETQVAVSGSTRLWGPWEGAHQVIQVDLPPKETRELTWQISPTSDATQDALAQLLRDPDEYDLVIRTPIDYQVIQRHSRIAGTLLISGRVNVDCDEVWGTLLGESLEGTLPNDHQKFNYDPVSRAFRWAGEIPAGGWYRLQVEARRGGQVVAEGVVEHFGVGEVFVGAGQSNSTNSGQFRIEPESGLVATFSGHKWRLAQDPQPGCHDRSTGGSYYPAFGDALARELGVPIGIAATGHGGTSVNQWQPDGELHQWMMTRIHQLGKGGFRAVLWHQGESDVGMDSTEYEAKLRKVIVASKQQAGWEFPWFVAQVSYHNPHNPGFESTRSAQARLWQAGIALPGPDTDKLVGAARDYDGQGIHFSPSGLKAHGVMWAEFVGKWLKQQGLGTADQ